MAKEIYNYKKMNEKEFTDKFGFDWMVTDVMREYSEQRISVFKAELIDRVQGMNTKHKPPDVRYALEQIIIQINGTFVTPVTQK